MKIKSFFRKLFPPRSIIIIINKEDREKAGPPSDTQNCLVSTALKNRGFNPASGGYSLYSIKGLPHAVDPPDAVSQAIDAWTSGKGYDPSVEGLRVEFTRI